MATKGSSGFAAFFFLAVAVCLAPLGKASAAAPNEIVIGAVNSLTGANTMTGAECKWAYEQAIADVNKKGGVFVKEFNKKVPVKLIFQDDKSTSDGAAEAMENLVRAEKVDLALSSNITPLNIAAATIAEKYRVFYSMTFCWHEDAEKGQFKYASDIFSSASKATETPFLIWESWPKDQRPKRPALMMEDTQDGQRLGTGFKHFAEQYGYKFVVDDPCQLSLKDFSSLILKWKAAKADALLVFLYPADGITFLRQMKESGFRIPYLEGWRAFWTREFVSAVDKDANYVIHDGFWSSKNGAPLSEDLQERFKKDHKGLDSVAAGLYYANAEVLCKAIERAGSIKSDRVRDAIFGNEYKSDTMGDIKFNDKGLCFNPLIAMQWWNGERMPLYPPNTKVWTYKPAPPAW